MKKILASGVMVLFLLATFSTRATFYPGLYANDQGLTEASGTHSETVWRIDGTVALVLCIDSPQECWKIISGSNPGLQVNDLVSAPPDSTLTSYSFSTDGN